MNILIVSNFYPPYKIGGYELLCQEVVESLMGRGNIVTILTSTFGLKGGEIDNNIHRLLALESNIDYYRIKDAWTYPIKLRKNIAHLRNVISSYKPEVVFIWGMWSLSKRIAEEAERIMGSRVVYYLANPWPIQPNMHVAYWESMANRTIGRMIKPLVRAPMRLILKEEWRPYQLRFEHAPCCSKALREQLLAANVPLHDAPVISEGINLDSYIRHRRGNTHARYPLSLLYVGILAPHKGVHTAIEAIARLSPQARRHVKLTILGTGHPQYETVLHNMVRESKLEDLIVFKHPIPRADLPEYLSSHDVLLLPSIWEEPLALIMQEGLASGLVVVGSMTGGTKEIIVDGENGILFPPENASMLAEKIETLINQPLLRDRIAKNGMITAEEKFNIHRMVHDLEEYLKRVVDEASLPK